MYWENATKVLQKELGDPLLRVEFDEVSQKYEILKWMPRTQYQDVPGFLLGSKEETVRLGFSSGYYSLQTTFDEWDGRVIESLRRGRPDRKTAKEIIHNLKQNNEQVKKSQKNEMHDLEREVAFDIHKRLCPTIYSYERGVKQ